MPSIHRALVCCTLVSLTLLGCPDTSSTDGGVLPPPQAFLTVADATVMDVSIKGSVSVSGCKKVTQVQLLVQNGVTNDFLLDTNFTTSPTQWEAPASLFNKYYPTFGLAAELVLSAKVICDDGRTNTSQPISVSFFPVQSHLVATAAQLLPDSFIAQGGFNGVGTTFIGCIGTTSGLYLAQVDTTGQVVGYIQNPPFNCSASSQISELNKASGIRWLMEPGVGILAFDTSLNIAALSLGSYKTMAVMPDGKAVAWRDEPNANKLELLSPTGGTSPALWSVPFIGTMNSPPIYDAVQSVVVASTWQYDTAAFIGNTVLGRFRYSDGSLTNGVVDTVHSELVPPVILSQNFAQFAEPIMPMGTLSVDGALLYLPLLVSAVGTGTISSQVVACSTTPTASNCTGTDRKWSAGGSTIMFDGQISAIFPFSNGALLAAVGPYQAWFLNATDGSVVSFNQQPIRPTGSLIFQGVQPGKGTEFYLLAGPAGATWPTEIVCSDAPSAGELWRVDEGTGDAPLNGMAIAVDDGAQLWMRVGPDQVKPLKNVNYRTVKGANSP
jgi:hypothetical protein